MTKKLTQEYVENYCLKRGYMVMSSYVNARTKIKLQNIKTEAIGYMIFSNFQKGRRFDNPGGKVKLTQEYIEKYCKERGYRVLSPYINSHTKIELQNIKTGMVGKMRFHNFQHGNRFDNPKSTKKFAQEEVSRYCESQGYYLKSQYINTKTKIKLQNIKTDVIGEMTFHNFQQGQIFDNPKSTVKLTYQKYIQPFVNEDYTVLIDEKKYKNVNNQTKVNVLCSNGHRWSIARNTFVSLHQRCPMCNQNTAGGMSYGERLVYAILSGNGIDFKREVSVEINGETHRFDFYFEIKEYGTTDKFFIEYDGVQHYKVCGYMEDIKTRRAKDELKDQYAQDNGIQMIRIPWMNQTIDKILFVINSETGLELKKVKADLPRQKEIADYYLEHNIEETMSKFRICDVTIRRYFKKEYGMNKTEYLKTLDK